MAGFRRPPRDVDSMTSLRVGNLPYRFLNNLLSGIIESDLYETFWSEDGDWRISI